jgi:alanine racemase
MEKQAAVLQKAAEELEAALGYRILKHILNSAGIEHFPQYQSDMVRLGIGLYGVSLLGNGNKALKNVATLKTIILQIQEVPAGDSIGYGRMSYVGRKSRIAIIPIGYADGLDRHLGNGKGKVLINERLCPTIGNICMDITALGFPAGLHGIYANYGYPTHVPLPLFGFDRRDNDYGRYCAGCDA